MAEGKKTYPMISTGAWWKLRDQFQKTLPGNVSRSYLATVLGMEERSAGNLLGPFRTIGIIDDDGKPTERANHWRFDDDYRAVCQAMLQEVYPEELRHAVSTPSANREGAIRWFMRSASVGRAGATKMATTYELIAESDPATRIALQPARASRSKQPKTRSKTKKLPNTASGDPAPAPATSDPAALGGGAVTSPRSEGPALHIDLQIHIAADASAEQIDQIFASMAKHLYKRA